MLARPLAAACLAAFLPMAAMADDRTESAAIRAELESLRQEYDVRIAALESRLAAAEAASTQKSQGESEVAAVPTMVVAAPAPAPTPTITQNSTAFNPVISLNLDGKFRSLEESPDGYQIAGFMPGGDEMGPGDRSFNLGESELTLSANIDPYFSAFFVAALDGDGAADVEEAYVSHVGLLPGGTVKFGRFKSGFGYQNEQHSHTWDFVDLPLALQAFFGGQLSEDGVQFRWLAPTATFVELGLETGLGSGYPGTDRDQNSPGAVGTFAHVGGDLGASWSYRMGGSYRAMKAEDRGYEDTDAAGAPVTNLFSGDVDMWGLDAVWKWAPNGDRTRRNLTLQAEYYATSSDGRLVFDADGADLTGAFDADQQGWYAQAVYQFVPRWRAGLRYDSLDSGSVDNGLVDTGSLDASNFPLLQSHDPIRWSTMVDFSPTEFSRLRVQYARDEARREGADDQFFFQYIMSMGAHGAHRY